MPAEIVTSENRDEYMANKMKPKAYDPAVVNVPLSKRGDIDKQLDKYKKEQAETKKTEAKKLSKENKSNKQRAKELLGEHMESMLKVHGPKFGEAKIKSMLTDWSKWEPEKLIKFVERHKAEQEKLTSK